MSGAVPEGRLPVELEYEIFSTAALAYREALPALLLIARRVHFWIEPLLWRTLDFDDPRQTDALRNLVASRPADALSAFLASAVRHVVFGAVEGNDTLEEHKAILAQCVQTRRIAISGADVHYPGLLGIIARFPIERFAGSIRDLFRDSKSELPQPDPAHPAFRHLTHMEIFDTISDCVEDPAGLLREFLIGLPSLTHFAIDSRISPDEVSFFLAALPRLKVFVYLDKYGRAFAAVLEAGGKQLDGRVVNCEYETWKEAAAPNHVRTYWDVAEEFLERKKRGEVTGYSALTRRPSRSSTSTTDENAS